MKKLLLTLNAAVLTALVALASATPAPVISIENVGNYNEYTIHRSMYQEIRFVRYQVTAVGEGEVHLYLNGEEVENPYTFSFLGDHEYHHQESNHYEFTATAQTAGSEMSTTTQEYVIPYLPLFYLHYQEENESILMELVGGSDTDGMIMYRVKGRGLIDDWQEYKRPFEIWRAPEPITGNCTVEVVCYAGGLSSNSGKVMDWNEWLGGNGVFRYYEKVGDIYIASEFVGYYEHDDSGIMYVPLYDTMCNKYWEPAEHPACYAGNVEIPGMIEHILEHTFYGCSGLNSVSIPPTVTDIGEEAFVGCTGLDRVELFDLSSWCSIYFYDATSNPLFFANHLFLNGEEIKVLELGYGDDYNIGNFNPYCFAGFKGLEKIICEYYEPPMAYNDAFYGLYDRVLLCVPAEVLEAYRDHEEWGKFTHIAPYIGVGPGDVDGDGVISITDVTNMIDLILAGDAPVYCDVDGDGVASISDLTILIDMILSGNM